MLYLLTRRTVSCMMKRKRIFSGKGLSLAEAIGCDGATQTEEDKEE